MAPEKPLPLPDQFSDVDEYVDSLLAFGSSSNLLQTLCGGVHILDFFTRTPDLYSLVLPWEWRDWVKSVDMMDFLDLLMREKLDKFDAHASLDGSERAKEDSWRGAPLPPKSLVQYIQNVRRHSLRRDFHTIGSSSKASASKEPSMARHVAVGMKVKKVHEVDNFARYVDKLTADIAVARDREITHLVDFGSGQNYLGRALASQPYNKRIIAVESKEHNIEGAKNMDVHAKLAPKLKIMRNKKEYRAGLDDAKAMKDQSNTREMSLRTKNICSNGYFATSTEQSNGTRDEDSTPSNEDGAVSQTQVEGAGSIQYVAHRITDGNLAPVITQIFGEPAIESPQSKQSSSTTPSASTDLSPASPTASTDPSLLVLSLHSCGNLLHHGLRSLLLNPSVHAVAMIGCCYNLMTERLGPPTYKLPSLRPAHPRLDATSNACDPHGFPLSQRLEHYAPLVHSPLTGAPEAATPNTGFRLNITARMMAVQAPQNWGRSDSEAFFTRHFYRALLQRIFLDRGVVTAPTGANDVVGGRSPAGWSGRSSGGQPIIIGSLRKRHYGSFVAYVRAAVEKLTAVDPGVGDAEGERARAAFFAEKMAGLEDVEIEAYEARFGERKKELSVVWSLMAFSAEVIEAIIVVDRWLFLREQECVRDAWVEPVFEYGMSPRNLVVVGIKK
ncbi:hypothetical protein W97_02227 [Coniosporium apollinis CBS 100218]|uniref:Methyltransferase domain-containing protein n=1 Tax=Coniosporium apollinis (strain CBS 100218) TaxID=1168221 RepID=R7YMX9_CONA1|nr:uncharacterized protein W97_02227 [Coniosporium apollinis CBS 100218]EON63001.1 hypothetical protein W97_02227 [Coniosporium apollinis CBS 100218]